MARVRFPIGYGFTIPTQLVLVPMLFLLPLGAVPLLVAAGMVLGALPEYLRGERHPSRVARGRGRRVALRGSGGGARRRRDHRARAGRVAGAARRARRAGGRPTTASRPCATGPGSASRRSSSRRCSAGSRSWTCCCRPSACWWRWPPWRSPTPCCSCSRSPRCSCVFALERGARVRQAIELSRAYRGTTLLLSDVLEVDDEYTGFHSRSVVSLSVAVADAMGLSSRQRRNVEFGALLHDVGKIAVPKEIINKPGPLTDDEWLVIKTHTIEGQRMLDRVGGLLSEVGRIVRSSHEKWDGTRLPRRPGRRGRSRSESAIVCLLRRLQRHDDRPLLPRRDVARRGDRRSSRRTPAPSSARPSSRPCCACSARTRSAAGSRGPRGSRGGLARKRRESALNSSHMPKLPRTAAGRPPPRSGPRSPPRSCRGSRPQGGHARAEESAPRRSAATKSRTTTPRRSRRRRAGTGGPRPSRRPPRRDFRHRPVDRHARHTPGGPEDQAHRRPARPARRPVRGGRGARRRGRRADRPRPRRARVRLLVRAARRPAPGERRGLHHPPDRRGEDLRRACGSTPRRSAPPCCTTRSRTRARRSTRCGTSSATRSPSSWTASRSCPASRSRAATTARPRTTAR